MSDQITLVQRFKGYVWNLRCRVTPDKVQTFTLEPSIRFEYPLKSLIGNALSIGAFETAERAFIQRTLKPGDTFLDIGANGGIFSMLAARRVGPAGRVIAFEPSRREADLLRRNIALNQFENIQVIEQAVSNEDGAAQLAISQDGALNALRQTNHPAQHIQGWLEVATVTLDTFLERSAIDRVDCIKMDVEGAERLVFQGSARLLTQAAPLTILFESVEVNAAGFGYHVSDFLAELRAQGLWLYYLDAQGWPLAISELLPEFGRRHYNFVASTRPLGQSGAS
jgi:FkbM family methyltransferase